MKDKNLLHFKPEYKLYKIAPKLFCVEMPNTYDLSMLFVRYQEYYESPNPKFRNKAFKLLDSAKQIGVNAAKIQVYTPDDMTLNITAPGGENDFYIRDGKWEGRYFSGDSSRVFL